MKWILLCLVFVASPVFGSGLDTMLQLHNQQRAKANLAPLVVDEHLTAAAQGYADYLAAKNETGHYADGQSPDARIKQAGYEWASWAENMALASSDAQATFAVWVNSSWHLANIKGDWVHCGIGCRANRWVVCFARPRLAIVVTPVTGTGTVFDRPRPVVNAWRRWCIWCR
jgi:uncharacterized protein YkwD